MAKKAGTGKFKTFLFWFLSLLGITGVFMLLNGPVGLKSGDTVTAIKFKSLVEGSEGLDLGIFGSLGKVVGTKLPLIALILGAVGALVGFGAHLFFPAKKTNALVVVGGALLLAAGVLVFFSATDFVNVNGYDAANYTLTLYGWLSASFMAASGLGFGLLEFLM